MTNKTHPRNWSAEQRRAAFIKEYPMTTAPTDLKLKIQDAVHSIQDPAAFHKRKQELWYEYPEWTKYIRIYMVQE